MLGGALLLDILGLAYSVLACMFVLLLLLTTTTTTTTATTTSPTFVLMQRTSVDVMGMRRKDPEELPATRSFDRDVKQEARQRLPKPVWPAGVGVGCGLKLIYCT